MSNQWIARGRMNGGSPWVYGVFFAGNLILIATALRLWGAAEIRADAGEVFGLTLIAALFLWIATCLFSGLGLSLFDDVAGRGNFAALAALCGALTALAMIYAGGSVGEGLSYWNNVFSIGLGTVGLLALWILLEIGAEVSRSIAEERDLASGLRLGGFLVATGLLLGRAVAGDWHSAGGTAVDLVHEGWPASALWVIALGIERWARPSRRQPFPPWLSHGLLPALVYLVLAGGWLAHLGPWEGMRR